jgi:hypothetical protein
LEQVRQSQAPDDRPLLHRRSRTRGSRWRGPHQLLQLNRRARSWSCGGLAARNSPSAPAGSWPSGCFIPGGLIPGAAVGTRLHHCKPAFCCNQSQVTLDPCGARARKDKEKNFCRHVTKGRRRKRSVPAKSQISGDTTHSPPDHATPAPPWGAGGRGGEGGGSCWA